MERVWAIFKKEFGGYFNSLIAYVFLVIFLLLLNMVFIWVIFFQGNVAQMGDYFTLMKYAIWLFIPAITMGTWAEERKLGTIELIMTMPVRDIEAVAGKFLAAVAFLLVTLLLSALSIPTAVAWAGDPDWGPIFGGYLGVFLMGTAFIALGLAISSMTANQFIAFIVASVISLLLLGIAEISTPFPIPGWLSSFFVFLDPGEHAVSLGRGLIDLRDIVYYLSLIGFFLFLNYRAVSSRRWK